MDRSALIATLVDCIVSAPCQHPLRVAIDGVDGVGKTRLAEELIRPIEQSGRSVIRASIDGFHNPRRIRHNKGRYSPEGYYRDSFNLDALVNLLLLPMGRGDSNAFCRAVFDYRTDSEVESPMETAAANAVLLFDGVFLHRPELRDYWDFSIYLDAPFEVTIARLGQRDSTSQDVGDDLNQRYVTGQKLYFRECDPQQAANVVVDNSDWKNPIIKNNSGEDNR